MASSSTLRASAASSQPSGKVSASRFAGVLVCAVAWLVFIGMALHTSRFPVLWGRYSKEYAALLGCALAAAAAITVAQLPPVRAALYRQRFTFVWLLVVCPLLALGTLEVAMRAFNLLGSDFYSDIRRYIGALELDPDLYFKNPANYSAGFGRFSITTNDLGLRDRPLAAALAGRERLLVLGDSVAFGWGVNVDQAFPHMLEHELAVAGAAVETVNSSVPGYNSRQELAALKRFADRIRPRTVVLLYVDNDIDAIDPRRVHMGVMPSLFEDPGGAADYFLSRSRVCFMVRQMVPAILSSARPSIADKRDSAGWRDSMQSVAGMARYCRERNLSFAVFHFRMLGDPVSNALEEDLQALAQAEHFDYSDTLSWFQGRNVRQLTNSFIDTHPNAAGHAVLAHGMAGYLLQRLSHGPVTGFGGAGFPLALRPRRSGADLVSDMALNPPLPGLASRDRLQPVTYFEISGRPKRTLQRRRARGSWQLAPQRTPALALRPSHREY